jgi:hypothetical protein
MSGNITVQGDIHLKGNLVVEVSLLQHYLLKNIKQILPLQVFKFFQILSKVVQKDIAGHTTLLIYSTTMPIQGAITNLKPIIASLPYR